MCKRLIRMLVVTMMFCFMFTGSIMASDNVSVVLNGTTLKFDVPPQSVNGRTMVPMGVIFAQLGATVKWDDKTQSVTAMRGNDTVVMVINSNVMVKNGVNITLDTPPQLIDGRTMVPVAAVANAFDAKVEWNNEAKMVIINSESVNTKRVGEEYYGYITVPSDWGNFIDLGIVESGRRSVGFASLEGHIINFDYYGDLEGSSSAKDMAKYIVDLEKKENARVATVKEQTIDGFVMQRIDFPIDDEKLVVWFFNDKDNVLHFISAEGPKNVADKAIGIVENTFSLVK